MTGWPHSFGDCGKTTHHAEYEKWSEGEKGEVSESYYLFEGIAFNDDILPEDLTYYRFYYFLIVNAEDQGLNTGGFGRTFRPKLTNSKECL